MTNVSQQGAFGISATEWRTIPARVIQVAAVRLKVAEIGTGSRGGRVRKRETDGRQTGGKRDGPRLGGGRNVQRPPTSPPH